MAVRPVLPHEFSSQFSNITLTQLHCDLCEFCYCSCCLACLEVCEFHAPSFSHEALPSLAFWVTFSCLFALFLLPAAFSLAVLWLILFLLLLGIIFPRAREFSYRTLFASDRKTSNWLQWKSNMIISHNQRMPALAATSYTQGHLKTFRTLEHPTFHHTELMSPPLYSFLLDQFYEMGITLHGSWFIGANLSWKTVSFLKAEIVLFFSEFPGLV